MKTAYLALSMTLVSCSSSSFSGGSGHVAPRPPVKTNPTPSSSISSDDSVKPPQDVTCIDKVLPIRLIFALDVTTSMTPDLNTVASNVMNFASRLQDVKFKGAKAGEKVPVQVGMIQFTDRVFGTVGLTDPARFSARVQGMTVQDDGNEDFPEAGLLAVDAAAKMLQQAELDQGEGLPIIVVVTDALAHNGFGSNDNRNCSLNAVSKLGINPQLKRLAVYDSSPSETTAPDEFGGNRVVLPQEYVQCTPYSGLAPRGPSAQWMDFRSTVLKNRVGSGRGLGFPFNANSLLAAIPTDLENTYKICK